MHQPLRGVCPRETSGQPRLLAEAPRAALHGRRRRIQHRRATRVAILQRIEIDRRAVANVRPRAHHTATLGSGTTCPVRALRGVRPAQLLIPGAALFGLAGFLAAFNSMGWMGGAFTGTVFASGVFTTALALFAFAAAYHAQGGRRRTDIGTLRSEQRHAFALTGARMGVWDWDISNDRLYVSPSVEAMLGLDAGTLDGNEVAWREHMHPADRETYRNALNAYIGRGNVSFSLEFRMRHSDGVFRWVALSASCVAGPENFATRCIGTVRDISSQKLAALQSFVLSTGGHLLELSLWWASVSSDAVVQMCRAAPNLVYLVGPANVDTTLDDIEQIGSLCPKLETVTFQTSWTSFGPTEAWERYFPNLRVLSLGKRGNRYRPTALHAIAEVARITSAVEINVHGCHIFPDVVEAIVGTPLGDRLTFFGRGRTTLCTQVRPEAFLAAARGFPRLTKIGIPPESPLPAPSWFAELALIRPLKRLIIAAENTTNAHVVAACAHNPLESLALWELTRLTAGLGDAVAGTQTAAVLRELEIEDCDQFRAADVLSLARACPKLTRLQWCRPGGSEGAYETEIRELITGRGGEFDYFQS